MNGHERLVKLLLRQGANPKQANAKGKTPLDATNAIKPNIKVLLTVSLIDGLWFMALMCSVVNHVFIYVNGKLIIDIDASPLSFAFSQCEDLSTLASSEDESMSDDGDPLTSEEEDNAETFDSAFTPLSGAGAHEKESETDTATADPESGKDDATSLGATTTTSASAVTGTAAKKQREKKSGSESGDGKTVSSPRSVSAENFSSVA